MKKFIVVVFISILTFACSKDDVVEEFQQETDALHLTEERRATNEAKEEILEFSSFEEFESFIREYEASEKDLYEEAERLSEETNYHSLLFIYDSDLSVLDELGIKMEDVPIVNSYDDMLHFFLNQNGEVKVADHVFRIDGEFVYQYISGNEREIDRFEELYNAGEIQIEKGDSMAFNEVLSVYRHNNNERIEDEIQRGVTHYDYFTGGDFRMKSRQFNGYWWFYSSIGASTKLQKKKRYWFFGWRTRWDTVKRYNRLQYDMSYTGNGIGFPSYTNSVNGFKYCHCNVARKTYDFTVSVPTSFFYYTPISGSGQSVHWAHEFSVSPDTEHRTINY